MSSSKEEQLREAACVGDNEAVLALIAQNVDVNSKNNVNGWTALHWAVKRGHPNIIKLLLSHGADPTLTNNMGETPMHLCSENNLEQSEGKNKEDFVPNYIKNPPLNNGLDVGYLKHKQMDFTTMPTTMLPSTIQFTNDDLVLNVRVSGSSDPDFIEIEVPRWNLTYTNLIKICCEQLEILESQVERIRKLPYTRLRKDSDVKRLKDFQSLEIVLKAPINSDSKNNCYQSISTCKNQTVLY